MSDSEYDSAPSPLPKPVRPKQEAQQKKKTTKRKAVASVAAASYIPPTSAPAQSSSSAASTESSKIRKRKVDIFAILKSEEKLNTSAATDILSSTTSSFTARVSSGQVRRTTTLDGDYFIDLKVYNTADWLGFKPEERYKKALSYVKIQTDINSPEWEALQRFLGLAFVRFEHSEPVFYKDTK